MVDCTARDRTVRQNSHVRVRQQMGVGCAAFIVAREDRLECDHAVGVGSLDATEECRVPAAVCDVACFVDATLFMSFVFIEDLRGKSLPIDSSSVAVPDINVDVWDGKTGVDIKVLHL
jgi:hypothetical protein